MNSLFAILLKNITLFTLITISILFVFVIDVTRNDILLVFLILGPVYVLVACYEAYKLSELKASTQKFIYFTDGFFAKRFIKIIAFVCCGILLYVSQSIIKYMCFLCFLIAFTEIVVTLWRYKKHLCFVAFEEDAFIVSTNKLSIIRASSISKIEARHGLTYFVDNKKVLAVRTDMMKENEAFKKALAAWVLQYDLAKKVVQDVG